MICPYLRWIISMVPAFYKMHCLKNRFPFLPRLIFRADLPLPATARREPGPAAVAIRSNAGQALVL